jgi:esterase
VAQLPTESLEPLQTAGVFVTPDDLAAMTARLPALRVEVVPGAGHAVQSDQPRVLADLISEFMPAS